jgi:hypothetical protein
MIASMTVRRSFLVVVVVAVAVCVGVGTWVAVRAWHTRCRSYAVGVRGEIMRATDGDFLYFNGACWTIEPMPPLDAPF